MTVTSKDGKTFTITGIPADAQSCAVSAEIAVYHTVTVTSTGSGTVTAEGLASGKAQVEEGQSITITAAPTTGLGVDLGYGVATIEINGKPLPKDEFDSDSHQFTIQVDSDTTVNIEFRKKESIYFFLWEEGETYIEYVDANITSGYEKNEIYLPLNEPDDTLPSGDFAGIPGADLRIEILNAETEVPDATLKYLYIVRGRDGTEILDCVELKDGKGTLEIQTTVTDNEFSLVATSTQPQTNQTE